MPFMRQLLDKIKICLKAGRDSILDTKIRANKSLRRSIALLWRQLNRTQYRIAVLRARHGNLSLVVVICFLIGVSIYFTDFLQFQIESYFSFKDKLSDLRSLFLALGGALIGASAIAFTLVMFAMHVNVERMPHGLFRKLSTDARIMGAFGVTFTLAIAVASISLIPDESWVAAAILSSAWGTVLVFLLFLYAYRRALSLINPIQQLSIVIKDADSSMKTWVKGSKRATPLFESEVLPEGDERQKFTHDLTRLAFFKTNPYWTSLAERAIRYAMSFATRYAEQGDHEVSDAALTSVVRINQCYVNAKGKTFFNSNGLIENQLTTDGFVNNTLEHLRQAVKAGVSRGDERFIEQSFTAMRKLVEVYVSIDYCTQFGSKTHALIATAYLSDAVKSVAPHDMADVMMEGTRLMGQSAQILLAYDEPTSVKSSVDNICALACLGTVDKYRPVTLVAMEQMSSLTFNLIRTLKHEHYIKYVAEDIRASVTMVAKLFLNVPDSPLEPIHSTYLGPYYSGTNAQSLLYMLGNLANAISDKPADDEDAKTVINNIERWADGLYSTEKELLLLAIEKRSSFTFDIINWIKTVAEILMAISNADACDDRVKQKLQEHALWIICTLSWIPKDKDTVAFVESYKLTETLFEAAMEGHSRGCPDISEKMQGYLLDWGFRAGRHHIGRALLERSIYGLATLALTTDSSNPDALKEQVNNILGQPDTPDQEMKDRSARKVRRTAATLYRDGHSHSRIECQMRRVETATMQALLNELADLISPNTADEPVDTGFF
jgi:hypothetical protein